MNKIIGLFAFLILFFGLNHAQAQDTRLGVRGGLNLSNLFADEPDDTNLRAGYSFALTSKSALIEDILFLQAELGYSTKGSRIESDLGETSLNLGYIDLPVMLSLGFANLIYVEGGVYAGYLVNSSVSGQTNLGTSFSSNLSTSDFNRLDYGLVFGANIDLKPITIGARYNYGLQNIVDNDIGNFLGTEARNSTFQVYVGLSF